jgi:alanine dehydrogenase
MGRQLTAHPKAAEYSSFQVKRGMVTYIGCKLNDRSGKILFEEKDCSTAKTETVVQVKNNRHPVAITMSIVL